MTKREGAEISAEKGNKKGEVLAHKVSYTHPEEPQFTVSEKRSKADNRDSGALRSLMLC